MLQHRYVYQPTSEYRQFLAAAYGAAPFSQFDGAFAYATSGGVRVLLEALRAEVGDFDGHDKRWLVSIDWCRSEPAALALLGQLNMSAVRVSDGDFVVSRAGCVPRCPFHPKLLVLRGDSCIGTAAGSGNLSVNGMTKGHEVGASVVVVDPATGDEQDAWDRSMELADWFDAQWDTATPYDSIADEYSERFKKAVRTTPPVTDDDTLPTRKRRGVDLERIQQMRAASRLWIEAGNLHHNLGNGQPGNQLMLTAMTRVFFGAPAVEVPLNTHLGFYTIRFQGTSKHDCSLRYSDNSMDVLTLLHPGTEGPPAYDQETLCFTRKVETGQVVFELELATPTKKASWLRTSRALGTVYQMQGRNGRRWGLLP